MPLTEAAGQLVEEFARLPRERQSPDYRKNIRTLTTLVYWLGAEISTAERDVHDLAQLDPNLAAKPVCQFLRARGLLLEDPELHQDAHQVWIEASLQALPDAVANEVRTRAGVLRSQGRREGEPRSYDSIRRTFDALQPALSAWAAAGVTTLREIVRGQVEEAVEDLSGHRRRKLASSLRSLFRALKQERVIFRDPARHLPVGDLKGDSTGRSQRPPRRPARPGQDPARAPRHRPGRHPRRARPCIRTILTTDLNLARGTLEIRRGLLRHTLYLEEFTHRLAMEWLTYRHRRRPASVNPYLLVSQRSALDTDHSTVSIGLLRLALPPGLTLDGLRQDRILHEALALSMPTNSFAIRHSPSACCSVNV